MTSELTEEIAFRANNNILYNNTPIDKIIHLIYINFNLLDGRIVANI